MTVDDQVADRDVSGIRRRAAGWGTRTGQAALIVFVTLEMLAVPLLVGWGRRQWFESDEWDFLSSRTAGNLGDWLRPHYDHWTTLPMLAYRLVWWFVGLHSYVPYLLVSIALHLVVAALLRTIMRRSGVGPWMSTVAASIFVFFGAGAENVLFAFQATFSGAFALGLCHLLLADHDGTVDRRDYLGLGTGLAALMCSGFMVSMSILVDLTTQLRRD